MRVVRTSRQCNDEFSVTLLFVDLVVIAVGAEMIASGIHCEQVGHDGNDDEEKGGELHDGNGLIQVGCVWKMVGPCGSLDCGNNMIHPAAPVTRERETVF